MIIAGDGFEIRPAGEEAMEELLAVYHQCEDFLALGPVAQASEAMVKYDLELSKREGGIFCGIYDPISGVMVGVFDFVPDNYCGKPGEAFLELLMISAPYRSSGLGAKTVRAVEETICRSGQIHCIWSGVQVNNPQAIRFWQRMGYAIVSGPVDYPDGTTAYDLFKSLPRKPKTV
jgi:ribosomal protein S18 acetylase RimI-like enzyme